MATVVSFLLIVIGAGHGIAPVGLILVFGWEYWFLPNALTALGSILLFGAAMAGAPQTHTFLSAVRIIGLTAAWFSCAFMVDSSTLFLPLLTAIPFAIVSVQLVLANRRALRHDRA